MVKPTAPPTNLASPGSLTPPIRSRARPQPVDLSGSPGLQIVPWLDTVADPHGASPSSSYVELYWLPLLGPSSTWLLRRVASRLDTRPTGFEMDLLDMARSLGLGERMGKNSPFRRALQRLCIFELARPHGPGALAVRTRIPPLPLRHLASFPNRCRLGHRQWLAERRPSGPEQVRRAQTVADTRAASGVGRVEIERELLVRWHLHPAIAFRAAELAVGSVPDQPGSSSRPAGVSPQ